MLVESSQNLSLRAFDDVALTATFGDATLTANGAKRLLQPSLSPSPNDTLVRLVRRRYDMGKDCACVRGQLL
jgi:hypothetical protein